MMNLTQEQRKLVLKSLKTRKLIIENSIEDDPELFDHYEGELEEIKSLSERIKFDEIWG